MACYEGCGGFGVVSYWVWIFCDEEVDPGVRVVPQVMMRWMLGVWLSLLRWDCHVDIKVTGDNNGAEVAKVCGDAE